MQRRPRRGIDPLQVARGRGLGLVPVGVAILFNLGVMGFDVHIWFGLLVSLGMIVSAFSALIMGPSLAMSIRPRFMFACSREKP